MSMLDVKLAGLIFCLVGHPLDSLGRRLQSPVHYKRNFSIYNKLTLGELYL